MLCLALVSLLSATPPAPKHWMTDDADLIRPAAQRRVERRLEALEHATGYEVLIWTGKSTGGESLEQFASRTFDQWKGSHPRLDHGAILFVLPDQQRLQVGAGLQHVLTPEVSKQLLDERLWPMLNADEPEVAFSSVVDGLVGRITGAPFPATPVKDRISSQQWATIGVAGFAYMLLLFIARPESYRWLFSRLNFLRRNRRDLSSHA